MKNFLGFGVVGNFAFHLEQAGEASDFVDIKTKEADAPKGIFPFYIPGFDGFLGRDCIDNLNLILARGKDIQAEPEIAIRCEFEYENGIVKGITPIAFMAFNDASIRGDKTATKISQKKNFSSGSKGFGNEIKIDKFDETGICNDYSLVSFLKSNEEFFRYGECAKISEYNYIYAKLLGWIKDTFNSQKDFSVLEDLGEILRKSGYKKDVIITIGATRYESKGENRFLKSGDEISIVSFNHTKYSLNDITNFIKNDENMSKFDDMSVLKQVVK